MRWIGWVVLVAGCGGSPAPDVGWIPVEEAAAPEVAPVMQVPAPPMPSATATEAPTPVEAGVDAPTIVLEASAPDVQPVPHEAASGGDVCPVGLYQSCLDPTGGSSRFQITSPDGAINEPCSASTPPCPTGWMCAAFDTSGMLQHARCP